MKNDLPIVMLDQEPSDSPWDLITRCIGQLCIWVGFAAFAIVMFLGAGRWWGMWELRLIDAKAQPVVHVAPKAVKK